MPTAGRSGGTADRGLMSDESPGLLQDEGNILH